MNKLFVFGLFALVAACAAAPTDAVEPLEAMPVADLPAHEQGKRAILYRAPIGAHYYDYPVAGVADYRYRYAPYLTYPSAYPYYGGYAI